MEYLILSVLILLFGAVFTLFVKEEFKLKVCSIFTLISSGTALFPAIHVLLKGLPLEATLSLSSIFGQVIISMDTLSAIFVSVIALMGFAGVVYANGYLKPYLNINKNISSHCFFLMLLIASMYAVTVA